MLYQIGSPRVGGLAGGAGVSTQLCGSFNSLSAGVSIDN